MTIWKDIKGYEGRYIISNTGIVVSLERTVKVENVSKGMRQRTVPKKEILRWKNHRGYELVSLSGGAIKKAFQVHRLVANAFIENPHNLPEVNHINGVKADNRVENLEWATRLQNAKHATTLSTHHAGENHFKAKLTVDQVLEMRKLFSEGGRSKTEIGRIFGVHKDHAINIINNKCWKTLKRATHEI